LLVAARASLLVNRLSSGLNGRGLREANGPNSKAERNTYNGL
jgi:hypothetical protein